MLVVETGVTAIMVAMAICWPGAGASLFARVEKRLGRLAARPRLSVLAVGLAALVLRLAALPLVPIPKPFIHDEFSYLLAGDTFASGRLTNPTHPMWEHMESFHITQKPTYMSMYFPAQGLILAAGEKLAGDPWYGVCASTAIMCAAICWMLQGWLPPGWALLGGALAVLRLGLFSYWVNGYYGGAAAAIGGSLVLGALPRIMRRARTSDCLLMALGVAILANARAWEGFLLCLPVAVALIWWVATGVHPPAAVLARRAAASVALLVVTAALMGYYNYRVFGNPLTLPYQVNRAQYASAPVFIWETPGPEPVYRHRVMREFYSEWELGDFQYAKTLRGFLSRTAQKMGTVLFFFYGTVLFVPLIMFHRVAANRRVRFLVLAGAFFALGLSMSAWLSAHYVAPFVGGVYVLLIFAMRYMRAWRPCGLAMVRFIPVVCMLLALVRVGAEPLGIATRRWPTMWYGTEPLGLPRAMVVRELDGYPGKQLAIVRYTPEHNVFDDWVYNAADVDASRVVWAREMDSAANAELVQYFRSRKVWLVEPDEVPPRISPYPRSQNP
jgi:hypothetical protein